MFAPYAKVDVRDSSAIFGHGAGGLAGAVDRGWSGGHVDCPGWFARSRALRLRAACHELLRALGPVDAKLGDAYSCSLAR